MKTASIAGIVRKVRQKGHKSLQTNTGDSLTEALSRLQRLYSTAETMALAPGKMAAELRFPADSAGIVRVSA